MDEKFFLFQCVYKWKFKKSYKTIIGWVRTYQSWCAYSLMQNLGKFCWYAEVAWLMIMITYVSCEYVGGLGDNGDYKCQSRYRKLYREWNVYAKYLLLVLIHILCLWSTGTVIIFPINMPCLCYIYVTRFPDYDKVHTVRVTV